MLPAIQYRVKSRLSLYNVIPPVGAPIHNFQNRDEKLWSTLQRIREMEKAASQQNSQALLPVKELNFPLTVQETSLSEKEEGHNPVAQEEKLDDEKCREDLFKVPSSPSDSEVEFSIAGDNVHQIAFRYSPSDQESSSDSESLNVLGNIMQISWPENVFEDESAEQLEGMPAGEIMAATEKY